MLSPEEERKKIYAKVFKECRKEIEYWQELINRSNKIKPYAHQAFEMYEVLINGNKRVLFADAPSGGKTLTAIATKCLSEEEERKKLEKKGKKELIKKGVWRKKALILAPQQALETAWTKKEIDEYCKCLNFPEQTVYHIPTNGKKDLDLESILNADFVGINYHKLGYIDKEKKENNLYFTTIRNICKNFDFFFIDECQNLKNFKTNRTFLFKEIVDRTRDKHFILLSATPVPNRLRDAGIPLYLLDPENYEKYTFIPFKYNEDPDAIKDMMLKGKWSIFNGKDLRDLLGLPLIKEKIITIKMAPKFVNSYFSAWKEGNIGLGNKIVELRKILLRSKLTNIEELVDKIIKENPNEQIVIFSYLKKEILNSLFKNLSEKYKGKVSKIEGSVQPVEKRVEIAEKFSSGVYQILINTIKTAGEGIPLLTYERSCSIIEIEPTIADGHYIQIDGRILREGQKGSIIHYTVLAKSNKLSKLMVEAKPKLEELYDVEFPATWRPSTIDFDIHETRKAKEKINKKVFRGIRLSDLERIIMDTDQDSISEAIEEGVFKSMPGARKRESEFIRGFKVNSLLYGIGKEELKKASEGKGEYVGYYDQGLKKAYSNKEDLDRSMVIQTAHLITTIIRNLEKIQEKKFDKIIDLGSGSAPFARILKRAIVNVDIAQDMLDKAKEHCKDIKFEATDGFRNPCYLRSYMQNLPFADKTFDIAVASYSLQYNAQWQDDGKFKREIEDAILESNRILKPNGYFIITLPNQATKEKEFSELLSILNQYGFNSLISGFWKGYNKNGKSKKKIFTGAYLITVQKNSNCYNYTIPKGFSMFKPKKYGVSGKQGWMILSSWNRNVAKSKIVPEEYYDKNGKSLYEVIYQIRDKIKNS